jgi:hypothetical protein
VCLWGRISRQEQSMFLLGDVPLSVRIIQKIRKEIKFTLQIVYTVRIRIQ